jgi:hypothetical protein
MRLLVAADRRLAIWWRLPLAYVLWFALAVLGEEVAGNVLGQWVGGLITLLAVVLLLLRGRWPRRVDWRRRLGTGAESGR